MPENAALDAVRYRFAEILDDVLPDLDDLAFADLIDECVETLLAGFED